MSTLFLINDFKGCTVEVRCIDEFSWLNASSSPLVRQLSEVETHGYYYSAESNPFAPQHRHQETPPSPSWEVSEECRTVNGSVEKQTLDYGILFLFQDSWNQLSNSNLEFPPQIAAACLDNVVVGCLGATTRRLQIHIRIQFCTV